MSEKLHWSSYKPEQAQQVSGALQILIDSHLLGKDEEEEARKIQRKLRQASLKSEGEWTLVPFNSEQDELLKQVEGTLWR